MSEKKSEQSEPKELTPDQKEADEHRKKIEEHLQRLLDELPAKPGVYQFKDEKGTVIYVGKAKVLRNRVRSYFQKTPKNAYPKTEIMKRKIADIEIITVRSELEALILETNLIKQLMPRYNVVMRDDKNFLYVKITVQKDFPEIYTVRRMVKDGSKYFGPYTSAGDIRMTLKILRKIFPFRECEGLIEQIDIPKSGTAARLMNAKATPVGKEELRQGKVLVHFKGLNRMAPCLDYHLKRCSAPCIGAISKDEYRKLIDNVIGFLSGKTDEVAQLVRGRMEDAVKRKAFEEAAKWRDQLNALESVLQKQQIVSTKQETHDVIAIARENDLAVANVFQVRNGLLIGRETFPLKSGLAVQSDEDTLESFITQYYQEAAEVPPEILVAARSAMFDVTELYLSQLKNGNVSIGAPMRGDKKRLIELAEDNAKRQLDELKVRWMTEEARTKGALKELAAALKVPAIKRIECYDISHIQGRETVGSMVVFVDGMPYKAHYRRFKVKSLPDGMTDDFAAMMEVLERRLMRVRDTIVENVSSKETDSFTEIPDLVILDGGKGQLSSVLRVLKTLDLEGKLAIVALAKQEEELFLPHDPQPIVLPRDSNALFLVQRVRDEAHRFALSYHQHLRSKKMVHSVLDDIPGIGPTIKKKLLNTFGSVHGIRAASFESIAEIAGEKVARRLRETV